MSIRRIGWKKGRKICTLNFFEKPFKKAFLLVPLSFLSDSLPLLVEEEPLFCELLVNAALEFSRDISAEKLSTLSK